ncbi:uncharacterized protein LOC110683788 [Chenopodium quinoa]|uniref:uncharacterized protein LOC110683786 n=1 Tax=Chenopodium quinoa TaxID=63459 RepID=UPI000B774E77|nr:uncharacterized protein LOC110683786 [Chenopodium quinoa]XP_021715892.1 uncharacterized protein LOC110683788 [Chenopodium quinoa]
MGITFIPHFSRSSAIQMGHVGLMHGGPACLPSSNIIWRSYLWRILPRKQIYCGWLILCFFFVRIPKLWDSIGLTSVREEMEAGQLAQHPFPMRWILEKLAVSTLGKDQRGGYLKKMDPVFKNLEDQEVMDFIKEESMISCSKLSVSSPFAVPRKACTKPFHCKRRLDFDDTSFLGKRSRVGDEMGFSESTQQDSNLNARITVPIDDLGKQKEEIPEPPLEIGYLKNKEQDEPEILHKCLTLLQPNVGSASEYVSSDDGEEIMVSEKENRKDAFVVGPPTPSPTRRKRAKPTMKIQKNKMEEVSELFAHSHYLTRSIMEQVLIAIEKDKDKMVSRTRIGRVLKLHNKRVSPNSKNQLSLKKTKDANKVWQALMKKAIAESCDTVFEKDGTVSVEDNSLIFHRKVKSFISKVGTIQGKRDYSPWKGSVLDSVIGALLTQRVGDNFSSSAFMELGVIFSQDRDCVAYGRHHQMLRDQRIKGGRVCHNNQDKKGTE